MNFYEEVQETPKVRIRYCEFADEPFKKTKHLCDDLGIEFEEGMLQFWEHEQHLVNGNLGSRSLIFSYRQKQNLPGDWQDELTILRSIHGEFYSRAELTIKPDLRWKTELSKKISEFSNS